MALHRNDIPREVLDVLHRGAVIPAHPLALDASRKLDVARQRALSRYYLDAGAGGLAVGVHTTQFAIRQMDLYEPVLRLAIDTAREWTDRPLVMIAGLCGRTEQALREAAVARGFGYHAGLLSLAEMQGTSEDELIEHCETIAREFPLVGFYLQPSVGGIVLTSGFWARFAGAEERIALYTGNDDHIVLDLLTPFEIARGNERVSVRFRGGLLGHWSVWVRTAVDLFARCRKAQSASCVDRELLELDSRVTDCNAAFFDVANDFRGCIAGCHEVLRRQGLLQGIWCLDPRESLSPGQREEIDRVYREHADLADDAFVRQNLARWLE